MNLKEVFLNITSYEEYNKQREKFGTLPRDAEFLSHLDKLYGSGYVGGDIANGVIEELYKPGKRHIGEEQKIMLDGLRALYRDVWWFFYAKNRRMKECRSTLEQNRLRQDR